MKHKIITAKDSTNLINIILSAQELKMLHNALVDILKENPEMVGYGNLRKKLVRFINPTNLSKILINCTLNTK